jgi:hypothetical protein
MKVELAKEDKGNLAYTVMWISMYGGLSKKDYDTEQEALSQIKHLKKINKNYVYIALYRRCEVREE